MENWKIVSRGGRFRIRDFGSGKWFMRSLGGALSSVWESDSITEAQETLKSISWEVVE